MRLATWNVNSVRARLERLLAWLERNEPDVMCLQETKATDEAFPREPIEEAGYHAAVFGQKTYNGVAILSRAEPEGVHRGLDDDPEARFLEARVGKLVVLCAYVPNGQAVGSDKWAYKLGWLRRLRAHLERHHTPDEPLVLVGDFNVAPDDRDVALPEAWADSVLCHAEGRAALENVCRWGLVDVVRAPPPDGGVYSWWDYRQLAFPKNNGLRLDHVLATRPLADRCARAWIDRDERKGETPSDHAPVVAEFDL